MVVANVTPPSSVTGRTADRIRACHVGEPLCIVAWELGNNLLNNPKDFRTSGHAGRERNLDLPRFGTTAVVSVAYATIVVALKTISGAVGYLIAGSACFVAATTDLGVAVIKQGRRDLGNSVTPNAACTITVANSTYIDNFDAVAIADAVLARGVVSVAPTAAVSGTENGITDRKSVV